MKPSEPIDDPAIPDLLSLDRHTTYLDVSGGDPSRAVRLYAWNIEISAAFWGGFNLLEVCLRNALHAQLTNLEGRSDWWNTPLRLSYEHRRKLDDAIRFVAADKAESATDGHVVAELTLSFWTGLLANRYHSMLWEPALQYGFPHLTGRRGDLHADLERLRKLRNRIAHHEPVFARRLRDDHSRLLAALDAIDPAAGAWLTDASRVPEVLDARRTTVEGGRHPRF